MVWIAGITAVFVGANYSYLAKGLEALPVAEESPLRCFLDARLIMRPNSVYQAHYFQTDRPI